MTFRICKDFEFSASHHLEGLPARHQCARLHGHNYVVRVQLEAPLLDEVGFVFDYGELRDFKAWIDATVDHRDLNEVLEKEPLGPAQRHELPVTGHHPAFEVDLDGPDADDTAARRAALLRRASRVTCGP